MCKECVNDPIIYRLHMMFTGLISFSALCFLVVCSLLSAVCLSPSLCHTVSIALLPISEGVSLGRYLAEWQTVTPTSVWTPNHGPYDSLLPCDPLSLCVCVCVRSWQTENKRTLCDYVVNKCVYLPGQTGAFLGVEKVFWSTLLRGRATNTVIRSLSGEQCVFNIISRNYRLTIVSIQSIKVMAATVRKAER